MCGRHVPESVFDPSNFDDDIYGVEVTGLGRGRGFAITGTYTIEDPKILGLIKDRSHRILHLIDSKNYLPPRELAALRALLDRWVKYARRLEEENQELRELDDDYSDEDGYEEYVGRLHRKINRETGFEWETLEDGINFLLEA